MKEVWKDIEGYEGLYQISTFGKVKSLPHPNTSRHTGELILKYNQNTHTTHSRVSLFKYGNSKRFLVHRLVALAFIPNPNKYPMVLHIDNNPLNNRVDNLMWGNSSINMIHAVKTNPEYSSWNRGEKHYHSKLKSKDINDIRKLYSTGQYFQREIAKIFKVSPSTISAVTLKNRWKHIKT